MISVIIPCYNQAPYLPDMITSLQRQTYEQWEALIVDDGSIDDTRAIVAKYAANDARIRYIVKANGGVSSARNEGLRQAKGNYIQFLDGDDFLEPEKFALSLSAFEAEGCDIVITDFEKCDLTNTKRMPPYCDLGGVDFGYESALLQWGIEYTIPIHCGMFKASLLKDFSFDESLKAEEDWMMWLHTFSRSAKNIFINRPLAIYRSNPKGATGNNEIMVAHRAKAIEKVINSIDDRYKTAFLLKINRQWQEQCAMAVRKLNAVTSSTGYKIGGGLITLLTKPLSFFKSQ